MPAKSKKPIIVGFVSDLLFHVQIENVATKLGFVVQWIERGSDIGGQETEARDESPGELLHGQGGALFSRISQWQPALLLFDLNNEQVPWRTWIPSLKSSAATRRVPIIGFGAHVDTARLQEAQRLGADLVVPRSKFTRMLPELLNQHARRDDTLALTETCSQPLAELARKGIEMFNEGHYYRCHDYLEEAWVADESAGRDLYRGILQVGIAYYQIERGNYRGALKMLLRVRQWLAPLPDVCRSVNVSRLREDVDRVQEALEALGPESIGEFDRDLFRKIALL